MLHRRMRCWIYRADPSTGTRLLYRQNRVPYYQRLYQTQNQHLPIWARVSSIFPNAVTSPFCDLYCLISLALSSFLFSSYFLPSLSLFPVCCLCLPISLYLLL